MALGRQFWAVSRLDLAEVRRSRWLVFNVVVFVLLAAGFVLVGLRESNLLGFSGMGRVLMSFCHAIILLLPLLALSATGQVVNRAREDGTLELLFSHPVRRSAFFLGISAVRYSVLTVPLLVLMFLMGVVGALVFEQEVPWFFIARTVVISATLLAAFVGLGLLVSTLVRNPARAMLWLLFLWAAGVALVDFGLVGLMLQWQLNPRTVFILATLNPVQAARMALLSGATEELSVLGPVGFYLTNRVGPDALLAVGTLWPLTVGLAAWGVALRAFRRGDVV